MNKAYSKAMIEIVYEIRRRIESEHKPSIKFANPELLTELVDYYQTCSDAIMKALIKELMVHAGKEWEARLVNGSTDNIPKHSVRVYRGTVSLEENSTAKEPEKSGMIYRGQRIK